MVWSFTVLVEGSLHGGYRCSRNTLYKADLSRSIELISFLIGHGCRLENLGELGLGHDGRTHRSLPAHIVGGQSTVRRRSPLAVRTRVRLTGGLLQQ